MSQQTLEPHSFHVQCQLQQGMQAAAALMLRWSVGVPARRQAQQGLHLPARLLPQLAVGKWCWLWVAHDCPCVRLHPGDQATTHPPLPILGHLLTRPAGELDRLRAELVALTGEMRRALAAASLAQSVALRSAHQAAHQRGGGAQRSSSGGGASPMRRRHWSYGQLTTL